MSSYSSTEPRNDGSCSIGTLPSTRSAFVSRASDIDADTRPSTSDCMDVGSTTPETPAPGRRITGTRHAAHVLVSSETTSHPSVLTARSAASPDLEPSRSVADPPGSGRTASNHAAISVVSRRRSPVARFGCPRTGENEGHEATGESEAASRYRARRREATSAPRTPSRTTEHESPAASARTSRRRTVRSTGFTWIVSSIGILCWVRALSFPDCAYCSTFPVVVQGERADSSPAYMSKPL